ncbi:hypothetical protein [Paenibacillus ginsengarvi]|uniref:Secreted protein n=1 Tax=Paenibacillus ginsengarvi TaxID=400777 RepID=A0A3B0C466_9BACL|nr:hypothetical protein [Paenibacillus ginsengarvi]RKN79084.1 hypothetical protein D7M11_21755 [Paenibacillus ginsengarvi]
MTKKKSLLVISGLLALSLLSACGKPNGGHGGHTEESKTAAVTNAAKASFTFTSGSPKAGEKSTLALSITDKSGKPVNDFQINHEKLMHLIVVSKDLSYFNHIHPDYKGNGKFEIGTSFPAGGDYKLFADFIPKGGPGETLSEWVKVAGKEGEPAPIKADSRLVREVSGKEIELSLSSAKPKQDVTLTFQIRDAKTKKDIDNLEPYLGAVGHVVILSADSEQYIHVHPLDEKAKGPKAQFATSFPASGVYKIWGQFQHNGEVFTAPFVIDVK